MSRMSFRLGLAGIALLFAVNAWAQFFPPLPPLKEWQAKLREASEAARSGDAGRAERIYVEALGMAEKMSAEKGQLQSYGRVAAIGSRNALAKFYAANGRPGEAEQLYKRNLSFVEEYQGPMGQGVGTSALYLGNFYLKQGRHADAEPLYLRAIKIREQTPGGSVDVMRKYAELLRATGKIPEAEAYEKRIADLETSGARPKR